MSVRSLFLNAPDRRTLAPGDVIFRQGEPGTHMYGIVEGTVELLKNDAVVATLGPNDVFGERALIEDRPRDLTAVAVDETVIAAIDKYLFLFLVDESPTFALDVMGALAARLRSYDDWIGTLTDGIDLT